MQLLLLDFDGVMTDNRVLVDETGREAVWCSRGDGFGIGRVRAAGIEVIVVSLEANPVVAVRCRKLKIASIQNCEDKLTAIRELASTRSLTPRQIAYVGNDLNDVECLQWVGLPVVVADAEASVMKFARWVTPRKGGHGAVRDVCDLLEAARGRTQP